MQLLKAVGSRDPARAARGRERRVKGTGPEDVDELIASLAESVGVPNEPSRPPRAPRARWHGVRRARPTIRPRIRLASLEATLYIVAALALGLAIGILAPRLVQ